MTTRSWAYLYVMLSLWQALLSVLALLTDLRDTTFGDPTLLAFTSLMMVFCLYKAVTGRTNHGQR